MSNYQKRKEAVREAAIDWQAVKLLIDDFDGKPDLSLAGFYPDDPTLRDSLYCWIGDKHWHDAKTMEDGLKMIIHGIANRAHNTF